MIRSKPLYPLNRVWWFFYALYKPQIKTNLPTNVLTFVGNEAEIVENSSKHGQYVVFFEIIIKFLL